MPQALLLSCPALQGGAADLTLPYSLLLYLSCKEMPQALPCLALCLPKGCPKPYLTFYPLLPCLSTHEEMRQTFPFLTLPSLALPCLACALQKRYPRGTFYPFLPCLSTYKEMPRDLSLPYLTSPSLALPCLACALLKRYQVSQRPCLTLVCLNLTPPLPLTPVFFFFFFVVRFAGKKARTG